MWGFAKKLIGSPSRISATFGILFAIFTAAVFLVDLGNRHRVAIERAEEAARSYSAVLAEHTARTFEGVDRVLREAALIRQRYNEGRYASAEEVQDALRHLQKTSPLVIAIGWTDAIGDIQIHSYEGAPPRPNIADLPYFTEHRQNPGRGMVIASPFLSVATGKWITAASRRLDTQDGQFAGIISAALDPSYFNETYRSAELSKTGAVLLLHRGGGVLAREPHVGAAIGRSFSDGPLLSEYLPRSPAGSYQTVSIIDGVPRIAGYKAVPGLPLAVLVSYQRADALAAWYRHLFTYAPMAALVVIVILAGTGLLIRLTNSLSRQTGLLTATLDNVAHGVCMFDGENQLTVCNRRYAETYGLTPEQTRPGTPLRDILEARVAAGSSPENAQEYVARRVDQASIGQVYSTTDHLRDGRAVAITHQPIAGGGWVAIHQDVTAQQRMEQALRDGAAALVESNERLSAALQNMSQGLCMFDASQRILVANERYREIYGLPEELTTPGTTITQILEYRAANGTYCGPPSADYVRANLNLPSETQELGNGRVVSITRHPMSDGRWVTTHEDITDRRHAEQELDRTKKFLDSIVDNIPVAVVVKDATTRKLILVNHAYEQFIRMSQADLLGKTVFDIFPHKEAESIDGRDSELLRNHEETSAHDINISVPESGSRVVSTTRIAVRDDGGNPKFLIAVIQDVTEKKKADQRISFLALHDALTGLANRAALMERVADACARYRRREEPFNVLLLDLDRFKLVNDTFGHPAGDALLKQVAERLKSALRESDVLARLGGDEFAIVQVVDADPREAARSLATRIICVISEPFLIDGIDVSIGTSIGIAVAPEHGVNPDDLMKMADLALYQTKSQGRNNYTFFDPALSAAASARQSLESELRRAIAQREFEVYYQPIVDTKTRKVCAAEALIRWRHPQKGLIAPDQFIPLAEETGLINEIGQWVLVAACTEAAKWPQDTKVAVNLSAVQLRSPNLLDVVICALVESGLPPERLELEITETALVEKGVDALTALRQFKNIGISIALDDFGTGYSSLSQLTMFPFDKIKIDKSFTQNMTKRVDCAAIISAVMALARNLDIVTTAEGVETREQCKLLSLAGVSTVQGYLVKRPGPASELAFDAVFDEEASQDAA